STGADDLPPSSVAHVAPPDFADPASVEEYVVRSIEAEAAGDFDEDAARDLVRRDMARARDYEASLTNHYAMTFNGPVNGGFGDLSMPVLVVHGSAGPGFPLPPGGAIPDARPAGRLVGVDGAGHGIPPELWDILVDAVADHTGSR